MELRERKFAWGWKVELCKSGESAPISVCSVIHCPMRFGRALLDMGGIGGVNTLPQYRRQGHARRVMEKAVERMQRERYPISFLHGIQDFYHRFGYITCMAEHEFYLQSADAERAGKGAKTRALKRGDLPAIARIYNRDNGARTGSTPRDPRRWTGFSKGTWWTRKAGVQVVVDPRGCVVGYVVYDKVDDACRAAEIGGSGEAVFAAILGFLARRAKRQRQDRVWVYAPADHPFAVYCRQFGLRQHSFYPRNERAMGRIIDFAACIQGLLPELARRWGGEQRDQRLSIKTELGAGTLCWRGAELAFSPQPQRSAVQVGQKHLMQMLMGYARPSDLAAGGQIRIPGDKVELLERLFPLEHAQLWWPDRF